MNRSLTLCCTIAASLAGIGIEACAADSTSEPRPAPSVAEIRGWIGGLSSNRFEVRETATKQLEKAGTAAVQPLADAAQGESLEVTCRAIRALEGIADRGDPLTFEAAQVVLERLAESTNRSVARRADAALRGLAGARRRHALSKMKELGAIVKRPPLPRGILNVDDDEESPPAQIVLNRHWKGGDAGLVHLRRIEQLQAIYIVNGAPITEEALAQLKRDFPNRVQERGEAMLGVVCTNLGTECVINSISPDSAAKKAGLKEGDTIVKYDGVEIPDFERLVEITKSHSAGDKIVIDIVRDGEPMKIEAVLTEWQ